MSSLGMEKLIEIYSLKQHRKLSHEVDASVVLESILSIPILKDKELKVTKPSVKPSSYKKRKLESPHKVETKSISVLHFYTRRVDNINLKKYTN